MGKDSIQGEEDRGFRTVDFLATLSIRFPSSIYRSLHGDEYQTSGDREER